MQILVEGAKFFAVFRNFGSAFERDLPFESQKLWLQHAAFIDDLADQGVLVLGGELQQIDGVLLICRGETVEQVARLFDADPWTTSGIMGINRVAEWSIRMGRLE